MRELADAIIRTALDAADPKRALERAWVEPTGPCRIVAFGKASRAMFEFAMSRCGRGITQAAVTTDRPRAMPKRPWLRSFEAIHPLPAEFNVEAAEGIATCVREASPDETLIALISGGGSAHLASPVPPITRDDLVHLWSFLMKAGTSIQDLNCVRRHTERFKGGRLAAMCPARLIDVFALSDVIRDPLHDISSGPFAPDPTTFADARRVLETYSATHVVPRVTQYLSEGVRGVHPETSKPGDAIFARVRHHIVANNRMCVDAISEMLEARGVRVLERKYESTGESHEWAAWFGARAKSVQDEIRPCAWIIGGEPVVCVGNAGGQGGPSQEVALHAARSMHGAKRVMLVAFSTDGVDGPSFYAGAIVDGESWSNAVKKMLAPHSALERHDSTGVLQRIHGVIHTGPTGTNLNHVAVLVAE